MWLMPTIPPVFRLIQEMGKVPERDMFNTFNMGIGMSLVVKSEKADSVQDAIPDAVRIGEIVPGNTRIVLD